MKKACLFSLVAITIFATGPLFAQSDATIRPGDAFELRISGVPSEDQATISSTYTVDGQGFLNLSYIGKLKVAGKTASEIQSLVERTYVEQKIFTRPTVALNIAPTARFVNIGGPGVKGGVRVAYTPDMTLMTAILAAGDFNEYANQKKVRLTRDSKVTFYDCRKLRADPSKDVPVRPGDSIWVDETIF